ncbi:MAG: tRNA pseudouridine(13) synthase TruD [Myxococcota bacterium]|nr:tRNA pseudouridine(13) synthase TruD [Myxococcota bacterium]
MRLGTTPEDFVVEEVPLYAPSGSGEHTFVWIEKRGLTTEQAARSLARAAGVRPRDVGYAGRKDKRAVTRQWLSVPGLSPADALALHDERLRVLRAIPHGHKLRTGQLRANRFELVVRELSPDQVERAPERLERLARKGMPNRFGPQRFGSGEGEALARRLLAGEAVKGDRRTARLWLSALQARVFNHVLDQRPLPLDRLESGDVAWIHASGASFRVEDPEAESARARAFEISPSGPLFGTRLLLPTGAPGEREARALREHGIPAPDELRPPRGIRLRGARRPLRVRPEEASCEEHSEGALRLRFVLPPGSYATALAADLFDSPAP